MKPWVLIVAVVLVAAIVLIGVRLDKAGLAVAVGVGCGILAGLPVNAVLLYMLQRERQERQRLEERRRWNDERPAMTPPMIVFTNPQGAMYPGAVNGAGMLPPQSSQPRDFVIVGEEETSARP
jgi:hypothetical protein